MNVVVLQGGRSLRVFEQAAGLRRSKPKRAWRAQNPNARLAVDLRAGAIPPSLREDLEPFPSIDGACHRVGG